MRNLLLKGLLSFVLLPGLTGCQSTPIGSSGDVVIGSKEFTEQILLGEILAQHIEATTDLTVDRRLQLGGTFVCHQALVAGQLDAYIEYTGTAFTAILERDPISDPQVVYQQVKTAYDEQFDLTVGEPLGFENTYAVVVRGEEARELDLETISDAVPHTSDWRAGFGYEFIQREDGFPGLVKTYDLNFNKSPRVMDLGLMYRALIDHQVDMVAGNSTDAQIARLDLVVLKDDAHYFPPYQAVPVVREATLQQYPELRGAIEQLGSILTEDEMRRLNYEVEGELRRVEDVAQEFLTSKGIVQQAQVEKP